jgi:uncharacterized RDD family membrane protein YckC
MSATQIFCNRCGTPSASDAAFCQNCGAGITVAPVPAASLQPVILAPRYAGFWIRVPSALIDVTLLLFTNWLVRVSVNSLITTVAMNVNLPTHEVFVMRRVARTAIALAIGWAYGAGMESSILQASLGKLALGLKVTDEQGNRITFARATARHFAKFASLLSLGIGYMMAGFDDEKQALHDQIAGTRVLHR